MCVLLGLLRQPGGNEFICSSSGCLRFLPASLLAPGLAWVQQTVCRCAVRRSETAGTVGRISETAGVLGRARGRGGEPVAGPEAALHGRLHVLPCGCDPLSRAPVEDGEVVDRSPGSMEKMLQVVSSCLPSKAARTAAGMVGWIFLTALKTNMGGTLREAVLVPNVQRRLEELEERILTVGQEPRGPEDPASLTARREVKVMMNIMRLRSLLGWEAGCATESEASASSDTGGHPQGPPSVTGFTQTGLVNLGKQFWQNQGEALAAWLL